MQHLFKKIVGSGWAMILLQRESYKPSTTGFNGLSDPTQSDPPRCNISRMGNAPPRSLRFSLRAIHREMVDVEFATIPTSPQTAVNNQERLCVSSHVVGRWHVYLLNSYMFAPSY